MTNNFNKTTKFLFTIAMVVAAVSSGVLMTSMIPQNPESNTQAFAATPNTATLIIGQVTNGSNVELSVCIKTDSPNTIHLTDATTVFQYTTSTLTPNPTIMASGNYSGNASYSALSWKNVIGTTDKWSMDVTYTGGTGTQLPYTPELIGKVQFAKTGTGSISLFSQEYFTTEDIQNTLVNTVVNYNDVCTNYGATTTPVSSSIPKTTINNTSGPSINLNPTIPSTTSNNSNPTLPSLTSNNPNPTNNLNNPKATATTDQSPALVTSIQTDVELNTITSSETYMDRSVRTGGLDTLEYIFLLVTIASLATLGFQATKYKPKLNYHKK